MRRFLFLLLLLVALALVAWTSCGPDASTPRPGPEDASTPADDPARPESDDPAPRDPVRRRHREPDAGPSDSSDAPSGVSWTVDIVDANGRPVPGLRLTLDGRDHYADGAGRVVLGDHPADGELTVECAALDPSRVTLTGPQSRIETPACIPLLVTLVDGETGADVPGASVALQTGDGDLLLDHTPRGFELRNAPFHVGRRSWVRLRPLLPAGFARDEGTSQYVQITPSRYAAEIHVPLVARPAVDVTVTVRDTDGSLAAGAELATARLDGSSVDAEAPPAGADGVLRVAGVPFLRDEVLVVTVGKEGRHVATEAVTLTDPDLPLRFDVTLPAEESEVIWGGLGGGGSGRYGHPRPRTIESGPGAIDVLVRRRNGDPAAGATVRLNGKREIRVDARGHGRFAGLADGSYSLFLDEPGLVETRVRVDVADGGTTFVELTEGPGLARTFRLRNERGTPLPFARVTLHADSSASTLPHLAGDVQAAWFLTDAHGELRLQGIPRTRFLLTARYGHRVLRASASGDETIVELELRARGQ